MTKEETKEYKRKWYLNHRGEQIEAAKARNAANREERLEYNREYRIKNREEIKKYKSEYYVDNRDEILDKQKKGKAEKPWIAHYYDARTRCTNPNYASYHRYGGRGLRFLLSTYEVKHLYERDGADGMQRPSIDRKDNDGDYVFGNCRFIEMSENVSRAYRKC